MAHFPELGSNAPETKTIDFSFTLGGSGAVASKDIPTGALTLVKTAAKTGRYTGTLPRGHAKMRAWATIEGPADAAFGNTVANNAQVRNVNAAAGTFDVQLFLSSSGADTDGASGYKVHVLVKVSDYSGT